MSTDDETVNRKSKKNRHGKSSVQRVSLIPVLLLERWQSRPSVIKSFSKNWLVQNVHLGGETTRSMVS